MASSSSSKKRKREAVDSTESVSFALSDQPLSQLGPILGKQKISLNLFAPVDHTLHLVSYPALEPSRHTPFQCYLRKRPQNIDDTDELTPHSTFMVGEAESIEFFSSDESQRASEGVQ